MNLYSLHTDPKSLSLYDEIGKRMDADGTLVFMDAFHRFHRDNDLPAVVLADGTMKWYTRGNLHREDDKPAVVVANNGRAEWWANGKRHRDGDKPAIIWPDGVQMWYVNGRRIR